MDRYAQRRAVMLAYLNGFTERNPQAIVALFANDATVEDPVGTSPLQGHAKLLEFFSRAMLFEPEVQLQGTIRGSYGQAMAMAFSVDMTIEGHRKRIETIDVMTFNDQDQITSMRAFWGEANFMSLE